MFQVNNFIEMLLERILPNLVNFGKQKKRQHFEVCIHCTHIDCIAEVDRVPLEIRCDAKK